MEHKLPASCQGTAETESESQEQISRRRRRKKDQLEEVRRNALAARRQLHAKPSGLQKPTTSFTKTLHHFAAKRKEITDATQSQGLLLNRPKNDNKTTQSEPLETKGFFRASVKGKLVSRSFESQNKLRNAILNSDALQLMQSGHYSSKEKNLIRPTESEIISSKIILSPVVNKFGKEVKYKRRLFKDDNSQARNQNPQLTDHKQKNASLQHFSKNSTPENVLFFTEYFSPINKTNVFSREKSIIYPVDQQIISRYIKICEIVNKKEYLFWKEDEDPGQSAMAALKATYIMTHEEFLYKQNKTDAERNSNFESETIDSSSSETLLEPDSAIRRTLKKNIEFQTKSINWNSENNSDWSSNELDDFESFAVIDSLDNSLPNRKCLTLAERSWQEERRKIPLSIKATLDPKSAKARSKISFVDENRQELVTRYLNDVNANEKRAKEKSDSEKSNVSINNDNIYTSNKGRFYAKDSVNDTYLIHKNSKHIPAILRKNRSLGDCIAKEKVLLNLEQNSKASSETNAQSSELDFQINNPTSNRRNIVDSNLILEAAKSQYHQVNAEYNCQPLRIDVPLAAMQSRKCSKNMAAAPEICLFGSPKVVDKQFITCISPIDRRNSFMDPRQDLRNYHSSQENSDHNSQSLYMYQLSQGDSAQDKNCMDRMINFRDIQERTDRLTLRSSQNQNCSQENIEHPYSSQEGYHNSLACPALHKNYHHHNHNHHQQKYDSPNSGIICNSQLCSSYNVLSTPQLFNIPLPGTGCNYSSRNCVTSNQGQYFSVSPRNGFELVPTNNNYPVHQDQKNITYQVNDYHVHGSQTGAAVQHQNSEQAVKFIALGENSVPQRRPIYGMQENNYMHKSSNPSQHYALMIKPLYSENVSNEPRYVAAAPFLRFHQQEPTKTQAIVGPDFEYSGNNRNVNNSISSRVQRLVNVNDQNPRLNRSNYVSNGIANQVLVTSQSIPMHPVTNRQKYIKQKVFIQQQLPSYSQQLVECQAPGYYANNQVPVINDVYYRGINDQRIPRLEKP